MIARVWSGQSSAENAPRYAAHLEGTVFPELRDIAGHHHAYLLQRSVGDGVRFLVVTLWESMEAIREFAGDDAETAVVEPQARAVLSSFDEKVEHYEVVLG